MSHVVYVGRAPRAHSQSLTIHVAVLAADSFESVAAHLLTHTSYTKRAKPTPRNRNKEKKSLL
jgi:hypothetical protein